MNVIPSICESDILYIHWLHQTFFGKSLDKGVCTSNFNANIIVYKQPI